MQINIWLTNVELMMTFRVQVYREVFMEVIMWLIVMTSNIYLIVGNMTYVGKYKAVGMIVKYFLRKVEGQAREEMMILDTIHDA